jgi:hypothetical protein
MSLSRELVPGACRSHPNRPAKGNLALTGPANRLESRRFTRVWRMLEHTKRHGSRLVDPAMDVCFQSKVSCPGQPCAAARSRAIGIA